jgi:hypothetical protein
MKRPSEILRGPFSCLMGTLLRTSAKPTIAENSLGTSLRVDAGRLGQSAFPRRRGHSHQGVRRIRPVVARRRTRNGLRRTTATSSSTPAATFVSRLKPAMGRSCDKATRDRPTCHRRERHRGARWTLRRRQGVPRAAVPNETSTAGPPHRRMADQPGGFGHTHRGTQAIRLSMVNRWTVRHEQRVKHAARPRRKVQAAGQGVHDEHNEIEETCGRFRNNRARLRRSGRRGLRASQTA